MMCLEQNKSLIIVSMLNTLLHVSKRGAFCLVRITPIVRLDILSSIFSVCALMTNYSSRLIKQDKSEN